jgi:peroxiredoxin
VTFESLRLSRRGLCVSAGLLAGIGAAIAVSRTALRAQPNPAPASPKNAAARGLEVQPGGHRSRVTHFELLAKYLADDRRGRDERAILRDAANRASQWRIPSEPHPLLGTQTPDFVLLDSAGHTWSLNEKLKHGPVVLVFYLGFTCDACVTSLFELNADYQILTAAGAEMVAISGDPAELTGRRFQRFGRFSFPVLTDPGHSVAEAFSTFRRSDAETSEELLHGIFVIGQDGRVQWAQTGDLPFTNYSALLAELIHLRSGLAESNQSPAALADAEEP